MRRILGSRRWLPVVLAALAVQLCGTAIASAQDVEAAPADSVTVELVFGTDIDRAQRTVVGAGTRFAASSGKVYCFTHIEGMNAESTVTHAWYHEGKTMAKVVLPIRSSDWRTWSSKRVLAGWRGHWEVKILDEAGKVLASDGFELE